MCSRCQHGLMALEAIANGEEPPPEPDIVTDDSDADLVRIPVHMPFPVIAQIGDNDMAVVLTNADGWKAIKGFLEALGRPCGPECNHE